MPPGSPTSPAPGARSPADFCGPPPAPGRLAASAVSSGLSGGNRCGHDPLRPRRFAAPSHHAPHPKLLVKLQEAIWNYYPEPAAVLPSLNAANGSARQQRSERREGCLALLGALVHYLDLVTLRVGIPQADGRFKGLTLEFLAGRAGLGRRRTERACRDLRKAGLVEIHPIAQKTEDGRHRGLPAVRRLSISLFKVFGLNKWLQHERDKAANRRRRQRRRQDAAEAAANEGRRELTLDAARLRAEAGGAPEATDAAASETARRATARAALAGLRSLLKGRPPG